MNYTEEQFTELEKEELGLTEESIAIMLLILSRVKDNLEKELRDFYNRYGKDGVVTYHEARKWVSEKDHRRRLTALTLFLNTQFTSALVDLRAEFETMLKQVIDKEADFFDVEVDVETVLMTAWGVDFLTWLDRLEKDVNLWTIYISNDWKRSMLQRKQLDEVLRLLDKRFNSIQSILTTLGLSESSATNSIARHKIFQELGIKQYQFYTIPDERRCETCGAMHGIIFPISAYEPGVTASPLHSRCRCWEVPIMD